MNLTRNQIFAIMLVIFCATTSLYALNKITKDSAFLLMGGSIGAMAAIRIRKG